MKNRQIIFDRKESAVLLETELRSDPVENEVLIKADYDVLSAGTELANYHGLPNTGAHWDADGEFSYPFFAGYSVSGTVIKTGPDAKKLKVGDHVLVTWSGHCAYFLKRENEVYPIPEGVDQKEAAFAHLCSFPFLGVRKLNIQIGEAVMVAGLGILGQFAVQIAKLCGAAPVLACDFNEDRRKLALELGADYVFDPREPDFIEKVKSVTDGNGPDAVVEVTGYLSGLKQALLYINRFGRISLLGCTRISDEPVDFYRYVHQRGVTIVGAHTMSRPGQESRPGMWIEWDDYRTFYRLVKAGRLQVSPIIRNIVLPENCAQVYHDIGFSKQPQFGILFDWTHSDYQE